MTEHDLDILAAKIAGKLTLAPRWLKLSAASRYASINVKRLKELAENGDIIGYPDPHTKRGDWIFDKKSIDKYRLEPVMALNALAQKIIDDIEEFL